MDSVHSQFQVDDNFPQSVQCNGLELDLFNALTQLACLQLLSTGVQSFRRP